MGYSLTYIAIKDKTPEAILAELGLSATNEFGGFAETPYCAATLPNGWYLVCENRSADFTKERLLKQFSLNCEVICCFAEEHVMPSSASAWKNGKELWSILHEADKGIEHLETKGTLPDSFAAIRDDLQSQQKAQKQNPPDEWGDVDFIFDIPIQTVHNLVCFRYDQDCPGVPRESFRVLTPINPPSKIKTFFNSFFPRKTKP